MKSVEDLDVFKLAHQLALKTYAVTKTFPREELFSLVDQMRRGVIVVGNKAVLVTMELVEIQQLIREGKYEVTFHAQQERLEENLDLAQIEQAIIAQGEILEEYPDDPRGESCLILAFVGSTPIHVVLGWAPMKTETERMLRFITVYPRLPSGSIRGLGEADHEPICRLHLLRGRSGRALYRL